MINLKLVGRCQSFVSASQSLPEIKLPICSDTRAYLDPSFFIAYPGQRANPLNHLDSALSTGCPLVAFQESDENNQIVTELQKKYPSTIFVKVRDAVTFTQELALVHVEEWKKATQGKIFAISGSNGKTTHKEMLSFLLKTVMPEEVIATEKNHNNHLGVPLTLLRINDKTKVCVLELGSNHPGEIKVLCDLSRPDCGLVKNIGATHLEFFDTEENVFKEEGYLYYGMNSEGLFFQNMDDSFLSQLKKRSGTVTFSSKSKADLTYSAREGEVEINGVLGHEILRNKFLTGSHNLTNMATAWAIAVSLFPDKRGVLTAAASLFRPTPNRSEWKDLHGKKIYLDAYNANPSSMKVAVSGFFEWLGAHKFSESDTLLILGDMNELGKDSARYHREVGEFLKQWPQAHCVFIGRYAAEYLAGRGSGTCYPEVTKFKGDEWNHLTNGKSYLFIKGSRSLQLESLIGIT